MEPDTTTPSDIMSIAKTAQELNSKVETLGELTRKISDIAQRIEEISKTNHDFSMQYYSLGSRGWVNLAIPIQNSDGQHQAVREATINYLQWQMADLYKKFEKLAGELK